ncbi:MAG: TIR domain-containing protein [Pseudonocardiaceae bacterium]
MADVFLSYAREDLPFVRRLTAALQARGREVWVDLEDIIPSARWMEEIRTGITEADAVVFVVTPDSVASEVCRTELDYATEASKRLVPILARDTPSGGVPSALAAVHWLSFLGGTDFEAGVDRLVEVLDTDIARVHLHTRLLTQARAWETRDCDRSLLLRGGELKEAESWLANQAGRKPAATTGQAQLILASRRAATRRQRGFGFTGVVVAVVMVVLTIVAFIQRQTAEDEKEVATARGLVAQAETLRDSDPRLALQLGIAAHRIRPTMETDTSLYTTLTGTPLTATLTGHTGVVFAVAFSPDGHTLATASEDNTAALWDITDRAHPARTAILTGYTGPVVVVVFSPDGHTLATASNDSTAVLWDITDRAHPARTAILTGHTGPVGAVAFSPDGHTLATGSDDHTAVLWDITDRAHPARTATLTGHTGWVHGVAFSPDGRTLATASNDSTAMLWDITDRAHPARTATLTGDGSGIVYEVVFSPDGLTLATGSDTVRLWNVRDPHQPTALGTLTGHKLPALGTLTGHTGAVDAVAFSPDGRTLATASDDTAGLWDLTDRAHAARAATLTGHAGPVYNLIFTAGGRGLLTYSDDNTLGWDIADRAHPVRLAPPNGVKFFIVRRPEYATASSRDGHILATGQDDHTVTVWNAGDEAHHATLTGHTGAVVAVAFSLDGHTLATASADMTAALWDITDLAHPARTAVLTGHTGIVDAVAFSPDGRTLATGSNDNTAALWDITDRAHPARTAILTGHTGAVDAVAFSPDGRTLATGSDDNTAALWDLRGTLDLSGHLISWSCAAAGGGLSQEQWNTFAPGIPYQPTC